MLGCSGCRETKENTEFHKNKSTKSGYDMYCKACRSAYHKNKGIAWPTRIERRKALEIDGLKICAICKETKPLDRFYKSASYATGYNSYCKECNADKSRDFYHSEKGQAAAKAYWADPEVKKRVRKWKQESPRHALAINLNRALKRRPTENAVTVEQLLDMWRGQENRCAISGLSMTWSAEKTRPTSISLDRIEQGIGYTKENVRLVCYQVNAFRGRWSDEEMFDMALAIVTNMRKPKLRLVS